MIRDRLHKLGLGWRTFAAALLLAGPDILTGLSGFDFNSVAPGWGTMIGGYVTLVRVAVVPALIILRHQGHDEHCDDAAPSDGGPH